MNERWLLALTAVTSLAACSSGSSQELTGCEAVVSADFLGKAPIETIEAFMQSDLESKYLIYLCGNQVVHPPALYLAESFARGGERVATFLHQKLAETRSDATVRDIIQVFSEMQRQGTYDVTSNVQRMNLLADRVEDMHDEFWRQYCADILAEISAGKPQ